MTIAGVVSHLQWVERGWFETSFVGAPRPEVPTADGDPLAQGRPTDIPLACLLADYEAQCARSREIVAAHELDQLEAYAPPGLELVSLRWILGHMIEETARHLGHLDALRELADGSTGY
jgi:hypothetical protein